MKLRYGMVGGGNGGFIGGVHRKAAAFDDLAELVAGVFSRNREASLKTADLWGVSRDRVYSSYEEMASKESAREDGIDFVCVATPNYTHYNVCKTFLEHGIHVVCDKPMTLTVDEAKDLVSIVEEKDLLFGVTYTYSGYPILMQAREIIKSGELGKMVLAKARYEEDYLVDWDQSSSKDRNAWQTDPQKNGKTGCTSGIGTHAEYVLHFLTGLKLEKLLARFQYSIPESPMETGVHALLEFETGVQGVLCSSNTAVGHHNDIEVEIQCEKGTVSWKQYQATQLSVEKLGKPKEIYDAGRPYLCGEAKDRSRLPAGHPEGFYEAFSNIYRAFCLDLLTKKQGEKLQEYHFPTVMDGLNGMKFVEACYESHHKGNVWVTV